MSKEKKEVCYHLKRCVIVNGLIKCKIKLLNLQYFDAQGHNFILYQKEEDSLRKIQQIIINTEDVGGAGGWRMQSLR